VNTSATQANRQIARAAGTVMAAFVLSNLVGLVRQILVTETFGTGREIDSFYAAARLPDLLFVLVAGGALASAFIPTFTGLLAEERRPAAWKLASNIANLIFVVLALLSLLCAFFAGPIVRNLLAPDFPPAEQALTVSLMRILLLMPTIFGLSGLLMGVLNAHQIFLLPALAPTMYWLGMIFGVLFFVPSLGIYGLAWGAVLGAVLHLVIQIPALLRLKDRHYSPSFGLQSADVREVARLMGPRLLGVAVVQLNFWINIYIATGEAAGSVTAITVAWQVMTMPQVVIAQALAIAALPTFSAQVAGGLLNDMRGSLAGTLRGVLLLSVPAGIGLMLLRQSLIATLFQRGAFDAHSTDLVAWALLWYALGLVSHSVVEIVSRAFYALHDTKTPVFVGAAAMGLNAVLSFLFVDWFSQLGWLPFGGLALANTVATTLEMGGLLVIMRSRLNGLNGRAIGTGILQAGGAAAIMSIGVFAWMQWSAGYPAWVTAAGGVLLGGVLYGLILLVLRVPELRTALDYLQRRLAGGLPSGREG
jgi:putative peptidoglycan lipid II flippase